MTEQELMLREQDSDFGDYSQGFDSYDDNNNGGFFDSLSGGLSSLIGGAGNLYGQYRQEQYNQDLNDIRLDRLKNGFNAPVASAPVEKNNDTLFIGVGVAVAVIAIIAIVK